MAGASFRLEMNLFDVTFEVVFVVGFERTAETSEEQDLDRDQLFGHPLGPEKAGFESRPDVMAFIATGMQSGEL